MRTSAWIPVTVTLALLWQSVTFAQLGPALGDREDAAPDAIARQRSIPELERRAGPRHRGKTSGNWGGPGCAKASDLAALVDDYLAASSLDFPDLGSPIPGASMSWRSKDCGTFTYVNGERRLEDDLPMTPQARMTIASMTKPVVAAVTLRLAELGVFGRRGLDSTVDQLLTPSQIAALTVGDDPGNPRCPGETYLYNRVTDTYEWSAYTCPDLSRVTLRDLMRANHGMYDILNEVLLTDGTFPYWRGVYLELDEFFGVVGFKPVKSSDGFDHLKAYGLKGNPQALAGGITLHDFEISLGNTGFQLLGVILEHRTGTSLDVLIRKLVTEPLGIEPMRMYLRPQSPRFFADGYMVETGFPEVSYVYPTLDLNGHTAVNVRRYGERRPTTLNLAGGAAGLIATPRSYSAFLHAFTRGGLLGPRAQRELNTSYVAVPDFSTPGRVVSNGFGLMKEVRRGALGSADYDWLFHGGLLPGARCFNAELERVTGKSAFFTGVLCINGLGAANPDPVFVWRDVRNLIADPATYGTP
jgi:hypothetical protein